VLVTPTDDGRDAIEALCAERGVLCAVAGSLGGGQIRLLAGTTRVELSLDEARRAYEDALPRAMEAR
jgi:hypothetical protein